METQRLSLQLMGAPQILWNGQPCRVSRSKGVALLAFLALEPGRHRREKLADWLWPAAADGRRALRTTLHQLKQSLSPHLFHTDKHSIGLAPEVELFLDVHDLLAAGRRGEALTEAAALYRGEFLAGLHVGAAAFEEWRRAWAQLLLDAQLRLLSTLADSATGSHSYDEAQLWLRRWLTLDPLSEVAHRRLMRVFAWTGRIDQALRQYAHCVAVLDAELGLPPAPATIALYQALTSGEPLAKAPITGTAPLPVPATPFYGREPELARIAASLADPDCRMLTLIGLGGSGKTRLALAAAARQNWRDGVVFVPLAAAAAPADLMPAIAAALGLSRARPPAPAEKVQAYARDRQLLLVLDNAEHLLAAGADLAALMDAAPGIRLLVTSRRPLALPEEWLLDVAGLPYSASSDPAVALFTGAARRQKADFAVTAANEAAVLQICAMVGGLPLALELAAGWIRTLSPAEIGAAVAANYQLLATTRPDLPARQRRFEAVFAYAWSNLPESAQAALARLSLFRAPFSHAMALDVAGADLPALRVLIESGLLSRPADGLYQLHEVLRQAARLRLDQDPVALAAAQVAYQRHFIHFLDSRGRHIAAHGQATVLAEFEQAWPDIIAVWDNAVGAADWSAVAAAAEPLFHYWLVRGDWQAGVEAFSRAVDSVTASGPAPAMMAALLSRRGRLRQFFSDLAGAEADLSVALALLGGAPNRDWARTRVGLGGLALAYGVAAEKAGAETAGAETAALTAADHFNAVLSWGRREDDRLFMGMAMSGLGQLARQRGDYAEAKMWHGDSLRCFRQSGNRHRIAIGLHNQAVLHFSLADFAAVGRLVREGFAHREALNDQPGLAASHYFLANATLQLGDLAAARRHIEESSRRYRDHGDVLGLAHSLNVLGNIAHVEGDFSAARTHYEASLGLYQQQAYPRGVAIVWIGLGQQALAAADLPAAADFFWSALQTAWSAGLEGVVLEALVHIALLLKARDQLLAAQSLAAQTMAQPALSPKQRRELHEFDDVELGSATPLMLAEIVDPLLATGPP